jgi:carboxypeptidase C (cathepsin A)
MQLNSTLFIKIGPKKIQAQNLSNCSQNIGLGKVLLKLREPSKFTLTPKKTDHSTLFFICQPVKVGYSRSWGRKGINIRPWTT